MPRKKTLIDKIQQNKVITLDEMKEVLEKGLGWKTKESRSATYSYTEYSYKYLYVEFSGVPEFQRWVTDGKKYKSEVASFLFLTLRNLIARNHVNDKIISEIMAANPGVGLDTWVLNISKVHSRPVLNNEQFIKESLKRKRKTPFGASKYDLTENTTDNPCPGRFLFDEYMKKCVTDKLAENVCRVRTLVKQRNAFLHDKSFNEKYEEYQALAKAAVEAAKVAKDARTKFEKVINMKLKIMQESDG